MSFCYSEVSFGVKGDNMVVNGKSDAVSVGCFLFDAERDWEHRCAHNIQTVS
jgi:hypothetical protein